MPAAIQVVDDRTVIQVGENTAEATRQANRAVAAEGGAVTAAALAMAMKDLAELASLTMPNVYETTAEGLAAVGEGDTFWTQGTDGPTLYRKVSGAAVELDIVLTDAALAAYRVGPDQISDDGAEQADVADKILAVRESGPVDQRSFVANRSFNRFNAALLSSSILGGGTSSQPNAIGKKNYATEFISDGVQTVFELSPGFVVSDESWLNISGSLWSSGVSMGTLTESSGFSVSGYGTDTITITLDDPATLGYRIVFVVLSNEDVPTVLGNEHKLQTVWGYDDSSAGVANIVLAMHSHALAGANHCGIFGGAYHLVKGNTNFVFGGSGNHVGLREGVTSNTCVAVGGRSNKVDGDDVFGGGIGNEVYGFQGFFTGSHNKADFKSLFLITGRRGLVRNSGEIVHGLGNAPTEGAGGKQLVTAGWSRDLADAVKTALLTTSGAIVYTFPISTAWGGRLTVSAVNEAGTKMAMFELSALATKDAGGVTRVNGSTADVVVPEISSVGSPGWSCFLRAITGGLAVYFTGSAENVRVTAGFAGSLASWTTE